MNNVNVLIGPTNNSFIELGILTKTITLANNFPNLPNLHFLNYSNPKLNYHSNIESVDVINFEILNFITVVKNNNYNTMSLCFKPFIYKDIKSEFIKLLRYRRCCVYIFHQKSNLNDRIIFYIDNDVTHNGQGFATDINLFISCYLQKEIEKLKIQYSNVIIGF